MFQVINPATGELTAEYPAHDAGEIDRRLRQAHTAFANWRQRPLAERAELLRTVAELLHDDKDRHAALMTAEMGKPIAEAESEVIKCAWVCEYYAHEAARMLTPKQVSTDATRVEVRYEPIGGVLGVMPWNFPYWQVLRFAAPVLMAGNVCLLKHAPNVPGCALALESVFEQAGFPPGVFTNLLAPVEAVEGIIADPAVAGVAVTGSVAAGAAVAAQAGAQIKKTVLELGGSDPFIVLADADPIEAAGAAVMARLLNNGQSCIASKRFIVEEPIADAFEQAFLGQLVELSVGDPTDRSNQLGPLARQDLREALHRQVESSVEAGARLLLGGKPRAGPGFYYPPTMLTHVTPEMAAANEETFGPLVAVLRARDADHAIELANATCYGLGASLWTGDVARGEALAARIEAGCVFINSTVRSDPRVPFGGIKRSGYGRELSNEGIHEFMNIKTIWVN